MEIETPLLDMYQVFVGVATVCVYYYVSRRLSQVETTLRDGLAIVIAMAFCFVFATPIKVVRMSLEPSGTKWQSDSQTTKNIEAETLRRATIYQPRSTRK